MSTNAKEYSVMVKKASPPSKHLKNCTFAFLVGGFICALGEVLFEVYMKMELGEENARLLTSASLIFLAALLTGLKVFDNIAKFAGAGTLVPITGFANAVVSPAIEFKQDERDIIGLSRKDP